MWINLINEENVNNIISNVLCSSYKVYWFLCYWLKASILGRHTSPNATWLAPEECEGVGTLFEYFMTLYILTHFDIFKLDLKVQETPHFDFSTPLIKGIIRGIKNKKITLFAYKLYGE